MLDYAANGRHYWDKIVLKGYAEETCKKTRNGQLLSELFKEINFFDDSVEIYFERLEQNLREGQLRIIFFMEESPYELRSIVDFLNKQMELSEVLLVEARQYSLNGVKIVVPTLFGYTEEARRIKREPNGAESSKRKKWNEQSFFGALIPEQREAIIAFYQEVVERGFQMSWGTGEINGSVSIKESSICTRSLMTINANGTLGLNFGWLPDVGRKQLINLVKNVPFSLPDNPDKKFPQFPFSSWSTKQDKLLEVLDQLASEFRPQK
jgi:hypothetical protein